MPARGGVVKAKQARLTRQGPKAGRGRRRALGPGASDAPLASLLNAPPRGAAARTKSRTPASAGAQPPPPLLPPPSAAQRDADQAALASRAATPQWRSAMRLPSSRVLAPSTTELDCIDYLNLSDSQHMPVAGLICAPA